MTGLRSYPPTRKTERTLDSGPIMYVAIRSLRLNKSKLKSIHVQINRHIVPSFYRYLQAQDAPKQVDFATELRTEITKLVNAAHPQGPFFLGPTISFVDIQIAPWILRMKRVLAPYRGWPDPEESSRWFKWIDAIENDEAVKATTSGNELYLDSYERYAGEFKRFFLLSIMGKSKMK